MNPLCTLHQSRLRAEKRYVWYGRTALALALILLAVLLAVLFWRGLPGFVQAQLKLPVHFDAQVLGMTPETRPEDIMPSQYTRLAEEALLRSFPEVTDPYDQRSLFAMVSFGVGAKLRRALIQHPEWLGGTHDVWLPADSSIDRSVKSGAEGTTGLDEQQQHWVNTLQEQGVLRLRFNTSFFMEADSRQPEQAGFLGAVMGSLLTVAVCLMAAFPIGVMTAVYLEEFASKGKWVTLIEVNINNLAAVPSIVFGLLGLAVYLNFMHLPRSAPLVGGLTLALMVLPVIIISTRVALAAVPDSIRQAALALGASPLQTVWHHTLPLALPGVMTGTILSVARALGETAPLLMIGMVAFVADIPKAFTDPATVMPVQVYLWAGSPEAGFAEKTSAGILVLLALLLLLNALAIYLRRRFEVRW